MTPDDPRHGTNAGSLTHERDGEKPCPACCRARTTFRKRVELAKRRGEQLTYTADELRAVAAVWLDQGLTPSAVAAAAGLGNKGGRLAAVLGGSGATVRRATFHAVSGVQEADFSDQAKVYADLTRLRIFSLMAAGHRLEDMPINRCGQWRTTRCVSVKVARDIRAHFRANEAHVGASGHTMARARNAGHRPPFAWDDPGTLAAEVPGWARAPFDHGIDHAVVLRVLDGETLPTNTAERDEIMRRWKANGGSERSLCVRMGWHDGRYGRGERASA